jgi:hypothetical protein
MKTIGALKDAIKEKMQPAFSDRVPADSLVLWNASIPVDDSLQENINKVEFGEGKSLLPTEELSDVFLESLPRNRLHLVVKPPTIGKCDTPSSP